MIEFTVGQKLWFVPADERNHSRSREVEILKIGRKWVHAGYPHHPDRFERDDPDMIADGRGYSSPGRFYLSKDAWLAERERQETWRAFRGAVDQLYNAPAVETEAIRQAATLLGLTLKIKKV